MVVGTNSAFSLVVGTGYNQEGNTLSWSLEPGIDLRRWFLVEWVLRRVKSLGF